MKKNECEKILESVQNGEEIDLSTGEFLFFMYFVKNKSIQLKFSGKFSSGNVKILAKEEDEDEEDHY